MSYSVMFKIPPSETVYCAVSNISDEFKANAICSWLSNSPYNFNKYWVKKNLGVK